MLYNITLYTIIAFAFPTLSGFYLFKYPNETLKTMYLESTYIEILYPLTFLAYLIQKRS